MSIVQFNCPACKMPCLVNELERAVRHPPPLCPTWIANKGKIHEFLQLTLQTMSVENGNLIVGATKDHDPEEKPPTLEERKQRDELLEQIYEGLKKL